MAIKLPRMKGISVPNIPYTKIDDNLEKAIKKTIDAFNKQLESAEGKANDQINSANKKADDLRDNVQGQIDSATSALKKQHQSAIGKLKGQYNGLAKQYESLEDKLGDAQDKIKDFDAKLKKARQDAIDGVTDALEDQYDSAVGKLQDQWDSAKGVYEDQISSLQRQLKEAGLDKPISDIAGDAADKVKDALGDLKDELTFKDEREKIEGFVKTAAVIGGLVIVGGIGLAIYMLSKKDVIASGVLEAQTMQREQMNMAIVDAKIQAQGAKDIAILGATTQGETVGQGVGTIFGGAARGLRPDTDELDTWEGATETGAEITSIVTTGGYGETIEDVAETVTPAITEGVKAIPETIKTERVESGPEGVKVEKEIKVVDGDE